MNLPAALPRIVGAKLPLRPMHVWTIRVRLQIERRVRDLALFDIALDSKLRGCDVVALRLVDIMAAGSLRRRATIVQQKTGRPVQFEITPQTRRSLTDWLIRRRGDRTGASGTNGWKADIRQPATQLATGLSATMPSALIRNSIIRLFKDRAVSSSWDSFASADIAALRRTFASCVVMPKARCRASMTSSAVCLLRMSTNAVSLTS